MFEGSLKIVTELLVSDTKHKLAHEMLDIAYNRAKTLEDYDEIGAAALRAQHNELRLKCAIQTYSMAKTEEQLFNARENLYKTYNALNYPEKALFYIEINLKLKPKDPDTLMNKAFNLALMNKRSEAEAIIETVSATNEKLAESIEYSLSGKLLREGKTAQGIRGFITTFKPKNERFHLQLKLPYWSGGIYPGKTIYIIGEGGIGDEFINIRFFDHLRDYGMKPILFNTWKNYRPDIELLFKRHGYEVCNEDYFIKPGSLWTEMMALPAHLGVTEKDLWRGPYIKPLRQEKNKLADDSNNGKPRLKIGIKCEGNPWFEQDVYRRIPLNDLVAALPADALIYYIDKNKKEHSKIINLADKIDTWEDTLDFIDQMDVIVSSCTSLVHAAGSMGKKTIVVSPIAEYYIWTSTRTDGSTPWYGDNFTILRQTKVRSWKEPLAQVRSYLPHK
jgi:hypothetical protein